MELISCLDWSSEHFISQNSTFLELLNTGQINILKNQELKENIITLYKDYDIASSHIKEYNEYSATLLGGKPVSFNKYWNHFSEMFDELYMFEENEWDYINNPSSKEFKYIENIAAVYSFKNQYMLDYFEDLKIKSKSILIDIEREFENRQISDVEIEDERHKEELEAILSD